MRINSRISRRHRSRQEKLTHIGKRLFRLGQQEIMAQTITLPCGSKMPCGDFTDYDQLRRVWKLRNILQRRISRIENFGGG